MTTGLWILVVVVFFVLGMIAGFFLSRKYMEQYLEENPPINEDMIRAMLTSMGQKPSEKRVRQITNQMTGAARNKKKK